MTEESQETNVTVSTYYGQDSNSGFLKCQSQMSATGSSFMVICFPAIAAVRYLSSYKGDYYEIILFGKMAIKSERYAVKKLVFLAAVRCPPL